jgi:hypothetical protein
LLLADDPQLPEVKAYDALVVDTLRDVHNKGAELFNEHRDFYGTYRMYQGSLLTVRPLLAHRPAAQKLIDDGLAAAEKDISVQNKSFKLHETIEAVRGMLKGGGVATGKTTEASKKAEKKPADSNGTTNPVEKKPNPQYEVAPQPRETSQPG